MSSYNDLKQCPVNQGRRPLPESYWVIPGKLLAGEYPGARDQRLAGRKLRRLLDGGFTCFIDLTEDGEHGLPPYRALFDMMSAPNAHIQYQRCPILALGVPSLQHMAAILRAIDTALAHNHRVYVHCWGGIGRTGLVVACYLVQSGLSAATSLERLSALRQGTPDSHLPAPATNQQRAFVFEWNAKED
jgi:hypothetical protein